MGILSGLGGMGLGGLENMDIFEDEEKAKAEAKAKAAAAAQIEEKDIVFDRSYTCPVCDETFTSKSVKSGKAKLLGTDTDLRAKYDIIDPGKYDVILCPHCGYAALTRFFDKITHAQGKLIMEKISSSVQIWGHSDAIYSYPVAMERYKLALVNAVVKKARSSEKAYICLKSAWIVRGYKESLQAEGSTDFELMANLEKQEDEFLQNAYKGFAEARQNEGFPMCGMDEITLDYLLAVLAAHCKKYDVASKMIGSVLTSSAANPRMKDKARDLKEQIQLEIKKNKNV
ncbi:MAG: DUF2225 domain-containing protein [Acetatifactor sp.]|nr:DUF2225 domain-containing protein [Acetatifactor sp.]